MTRVAGLLLAAGAGRRFGGPKALATLDGAPLVVRALAALTEGGCSPVRVVLGAQADDVRRLLPDPEIAVTAPDWESGMGASLRRGMAEVATLDPAPDAVLVHLVDLPDVGSDVVARLVALAGPRALARAEYGAGPGHPVLCGRAWWSEFVAGADGDRGARDFLDGHPDLQVIDCADLAGGRDVDRAADLGR
jgi:CTP:molybdopterin cytidylyltransferase MocA